MHSGLRRDMDQPTHNTSTGALRKEARIEQILQKAKLPSPPAVALQVVKAASDPDCSSRDIAAILSRDPVLCGKVLKAVNSCVYNTGKQTIATVDWAVVNLGMNALRSLVLGLSLPMAQAGRKLGPAQRDFWISSVSGAILAMELSAKVKGNSPSLDLVAGLLRDLGQLALYDAEPRGWERYHALPHEETLMNPCRAEEEIFGVNHVDVTVRILSDWKLPEYIVEPIRFHHDPHAKSETGKRWSQRAEHLQFVDWLVRLDQVVEVPYILQELLRRAEVQYQLGKSELIAFLQQVEPKISEFKRLLDLDLHELPSHADILSRGCEALVDLTIQTHIASATAIPVNLLASDTHVTVPSEKTAQVGTSQTRRAAPVDLPPFTAAMIAKVPPRRISTRWLSRPTRTWARSDGGRFRRIRSVPESRSRHQDDLAGAGEFRGFPHSVCPRGAVPGIDP